MAIHPGISKDRVHILALKAATEQAFTLADAVGEGEFFRRVIVPMIGINYTGK